MRFTLVFITAIFMFYASSLVAVPPKLTMIDSLKKDIRELQRNDSISNLRNDILELKYLKARHAKEDALLKKSVYEEISQFKTDYYNATITIFAIILGIGTSVWNWRQYKTYVKPFKEHIDKANKESNIAKQVASDAIRDANEAKGIADDTILEIDLIYKDSIMDLIIQWTFILTATKESKQYFLFLVISKHAFKRIIYANTTYSENKLNSFNLQIDGFIDLYYTLTNKLGLNNIKIDNIELDLLVGLIANIDNLTKVKYYINNEFLIKIISTLNNIKDNNIDTIIDIDKDS